MCSIFCLTGKTVPQEESKKAFYASFGEPDKIIDYREALLLSRTHVDK